MVTLNIAMIRAKKMPRTTARALKRLLVADKKMDSRLKLILIPFLKEVHLEDLRVDSFFSLHILLDGLSFLRYFLL